MSLVSRSRGLAPAKRSEDGSGFLPSLESTTAQAAAIITFTLSIGLNAALPDPTPPWQAMDYGPFLTASIEAPHPATNIAYKGIAINLGENFGGDHNEAGDLRYRPAPLLRRLDRRFRRPQRRGLRR